MFGASPSEKAYITPFAVFIGLALAAQAISHPFEGLESSWWLSEPRYWVNPLQAALAGALLLIWRKRYPLSRPKGVLFALAAAIISFMLWVSPQELFHAPLRTDGFDPYFFGASPSRLIPNLGLRFIRLVVVVPFVEEIFWRGFLLRYVIDQDFERVPFGTWSQKSFWVCVIGFCLEHASADYPAALATGVLYNLVACRTKSLSSCVIAHAATNLLLGIYVLHTRQWGFW